MNSTRGRKPEPEYPTYSLKERDRRWQLARDVMSEQEVDALLVWPERIRACGAPAAAPDTYLTNERPGSVVIFPRDDEPVALVAATQNISAHMEALERGEDTWVKPEKMYIGKTSGDIVSRLCDLGLASSRIGVIGLDYFGNHHKEGIIPYTTWARVRENLPDAKFKPVWRPFAEKMLVLSDEEIAALRQSANAGERMCEALLELTRPGVSEAELYAAALAECYRAGADSTWFILQTGPDNSSWGPANWTFRPQRPRVIQDGDIVMAEFFPSYGTMESQQQMCIAVGAVDPVHETCEKVVMASYAAGLEKLRPGVPFGDVAEAMGEPAKDAGGWHLTPHIHSLNPMFLGGPVGVGAKDSLPNADRYPFTDPIPARHTDTHVEPGMTFAFEPNCHMGKRRINIGGTVLLTPVGPEELNMLPNVVHRVG